MSVSKLCHFEKVSAKVSVFNGDLMVISKRYPFSKLCHNSNGKRYPFFWPLYPYNGDLPIDEDYDDIYMYPYNGDVCAKNIIFVPVQWRPLYPYNGDFFRA